MVVVLGVVLIITSRNETLDRLDERGSEHPTTEEHWHSAYGFYFCDQFSPPLADNGRDPLGIHTHGDGIIHVHPFSQAASGNRATFDKFEDTMGITVDRDRLEVGDKKFSNGDKCGDKAGEVRVLVDGKPYDGDPGKIKFGDRQSLVFAFAPKDAEVPPQPPSFGGLNNLSDVPGGGAPQSGVPNEATTSSVPGPEDGSTSTSEPPASTPPPDPGATTSSSTP
jgi:hypothetical protein